MIDLTTKYTKNHEKKHRHEFHELTLKEKRPDSPLRPRAQREAEVKSERYLTTEGHGKAQRKR